MLHYHEMISFRKEIDKILTTLCETNDMIERNTFYHDIKINMIPIWKEKVKYCTDTSFFLEKKLEEMQKKIEIKS